MINSSLNVILTHIADPTQLEDLHEIISHAEYGVIEEHVDYFICSFIKALQEVFSDESTKNLLDIWSKVITEIMTYFKNNL